MGTENLASQMMLKCNPTLSGDGLLRCVAFPPLLFTKSCLQLLFPQFDSVRHFRPCIPK